ncbi:histidine phosphatase family protein [Chthonobacter albigriseus]|uniref:histidine phosphatase family protein n=1 Tax=Chthonobacter albigriseus TaxID=1683161 RepID=UPI001FCE8A0B|nr:histidine phosphatase family protein [Chthonobacter albigriseus]
MRTLLAFLLLLAGAVQAVADPAGWAALKAPGSHGLMRHASAPGTGDPPEFKLGDCSTQRNLDDGGRAQAQRIGEAARSAGIAPDVVLTSAWCRAEETARLLDLGPVEQEPSLNSFFQDRSTAEQATADLKRRLEELGTRKAMLVTHQVNITALTGIFPASGEIVVIGLGRSGEVEVRGRIKPQ